MHARVSLFLIAGAVALIAAGGPAIAAVDVAERAPALVVPELDGRVFDLAAVRGQTVIINFWATWCVPCRAEMPALDAFYRHYHDRGLTLIGVSADRPRDRDDVVTVMHAFSYPAAMLKDATTNGFGAPAALPLTYVIDRDGVIRAKFSPAANGVTEQALDAAVLPLLNAAARPGG